MPDYYYHSANGSTAPWAIHRNYFTALVIENGVTSIGQYAFYNCSGFTGSLTIPEGVTGIGNYAFSDCSDFTGSLTIPEGITGIGQSAFNGCRGFTGSLTIPEGVTSIGNTAFQNCSGFTEIINHETTPQTIETNVFNAINKTVVTLRVPAASVVAYQIADVWKDFVNIVAIGEDNGCETIIASGEAGENITWTLCEDGTLTISGEGDMPDYSSTYFGDTNFTTAPWNSHQSLINNVVIENGVTSIGIDAFVFCSDLSSVTISNSVITIGASAFGHCRSLTSVSLGNSITNIGIHAFTSCDLRSVTIPASVISIGHKAFTYNYNLPSIEVDEGNDLYTSVDGVLFSKDKSTLVQYPAGKQDAGYIIPESVTTLMEGSFESCNTLVSVTIPNTVISIESHVFVNCTGLIEVINYATTPQPINTSVFDNVNIGAVTLRVPAGSEDTYHAAEVWKDFGVITSDQTAQYLYIMFNSKGGTPVDAQPLTKGEKAIYPWNDPNRFGYTFGGWFIEDECENGYDFDTAVTSNITLYAKWTELPPKTCQDPIRIVRIKVLVEIPVVDG